MRKLIWLTVLMALGLAGGAASAQGPITGYCTLGAKQAAVSGLNSTNYLQGIIRSCTVTVFLTGTTTPATIYSTSTSTPLANPFTANATTGQWLFYAGTGSLYDVVLSGGISPNTYPAPVTLTGLQPGGGGGGGSGCTPSGATNSLQKNNGSGGCAGSSAIDNGTTFAVSEPVTAPSFNGVALSTAGPNTQYLDKTGAYSTPAGSGGAAFPTSGAPGIVYVAGNSASTSTVATSPQLVTALNASPSSTLSPSLLPPNTPINTINIQSSPYYASGSSASTTTTASLSSGSTSVPVASCTDFVIASAGTQYGHQGVYIAGAGASSAQYIGTVSTCVGTTMIITPATSATVAAATTTATLTVGTTGAPSSITVASATGIVAGDTITGTGIASGTLVVAVSGTTIIPSQPPTTAGTGVSLTFTPTVMHDETAAIQAAISTAGYGTVTKIFFPATPISGGTTSSAYLVNGVPPNPGTCNCILQVPTLQYVTAPLHAPAQIEMYGPIAPASTGSSGAIIRTYQASTNGALIGGYATGSTTPTNTTNVQVYIHDMTWRSYDNPTITMLGGFNLATFGMDRVNVDTGFVENCGYETSTQCSPYPTFPTNTNGIAVVTSGLDSIGGFLKFSGVTVDHYYTGFYVSEHANIDTDTVIFGHTCIELGNPSPGHMIQVAYVSCEHDVWDFDGQASDINIVSLENESLTSAQAGGNTTLIHDPSNTINGIMNYEDIDVGQGGGTTTVQNGGINVRIQNLNTGAILTSPYAIFSTTSGTGAPLELLNNFSVTSGSTVGTSNGFCPNMATGAACFVGVGKDSANVGDEAGFSFIYRGVGNAGNSASIGFNTVSIAPIQSWFFSNDTSIGNSTDSGKLLGVGSANQFTVDTSGNTILPALTVSGITGSTQCLQASTLGVVSGTGSACGSGGGGGNTTSTSLTTNFLSKANGANSIINSLVSDSGTLLNYTGSAGIFSSVTGAAAGFVAVNPVTNFPRAQFLIGNTTSDTNVLEYISPSQSSSGLQIPAGVFVTTDKTVTDASEKSFGLLVSTTASSILSTSKDGNATGTAGNPVVIGIQPTGSTTPTTVVTATLNGLSSGFPYYTPATTGSYSFGSASNTSGTQTAGISSQSAGTLSVDTTTIGNGLGSITAATFNGNSLTATNLSSYPSLCSGGQFSQGLSSGSNNCGTPSGGSATVIQVNGTPTTTATPVNLRNGSGNGGIAFTNPSVGNVDANLSKPFGSGTNFTTGVAANTINELAYFPGTDGRVADSTILITDVMQLGNTQTVTGAKTFSALQTYSAGNNFSGTTSPLQMAGSAGTSGNCLLSGGAGVTPSWGSCGGGSSAFSGLTSGTNTAAAMLVGTGASLGATGTGTIAASSSVNLTGGALSSFPYQSAANTTAFVAGSAVNGTYIPAEVVTTSALTTPTLLNLATYLASPPQIGSTTPAQGFFTNLFYTGTLNSQNALGLTTFQNSGCAPNASNSCFLFNSNMASQSSSANLNLIGTNGGLMSPLSGTMTVTGRWAGLNLASITCGNGSNTTYNGSDLCTGINLAFTENVNTASTVGFCGLCVDFTKTSVSSTAVGFSWRFRTAGSVTASLTEPGLLSAVHYAGISAAPTIAAGTGAGTGPTVTVTNTNDSNGYVQVLTGTAPSATASVFTVTFATAYGQSPKCFMWPDNAITEALTGIAAVQIFDPSTTVATATSGATALVSATTYKWGYSCQQ